jgi:flavin reductase (DIM6/NTAB) family NADH-FMN oxidoreductase RutF
MAAKSIGPALGRIPSGCAILTAKSASRRTGMLASWMQQAAFEPPMISVAIHRDRWIHSIIDESGHFIANILSDNPGPMFKHFGKGFAPDEDAFTGLAVQDHAAGIIIADQLAWLAAQVRGKHTAGDHFIYLAEVTDAGTMDGAKPYVHLRKNGLSY